MSKVVVIRAEEGKIVETNIEDKAMDQLIKEIARKALEEWEPSLSDFTVLHSKLELRYKKPLPAHVADAIFDLNLEYSHEGDEVIVNLPVIVISFDNRWLDESRYEERKIYVIAPYIDEATLEQLKEYAIDTTKGPKDVLGITSQELELSEEELKRLEEGLTEEEEEKPRKRKGRRRTKSS